MQQEFLYVYQVYKDGSFSKAARSLYITQPALSIAIQKIESSVGLPLFDRSQRPLTLTPAGEVYISTIEKSMLLEQEMYQRLEDIQNMQTGSISLGGSHYLNAYILPEILSGFCQKYPHIDIVLKEHSAATLSAMLSAHELDMTFSCNEEFMSGFERYPAFTDHVLLAVQKDHPVNSSLSDFVLTADDIEKGRHLSDTCPAVSLNFFRDMDFILLSPGNNLHERSMKMFDTAGFAPSVKLQLSQLVTAYHLAEHFPAATFVSDRLVMHSHAPLCYYRLDYECAERTFYMLLPKRNYTSIATRTFIQYFREQI